MSDIFTFQKRTGVMVDLETMSTRSNACILSIGACKFSFLENKILDSFKVNVDPKSCKSHKMHFDVETIDWWSRQSKEAISSWKQDQLSLEDALIKFNEWWGDEKLTFWCNGLSFDSPILSNAYYATGIVKPWSYSDELDLRTAFKIINFDLRDARSTSDKVHHDSQCDAEEQARYLLDFFGIENTE